MRLLILVLAVLVLSPRDVFADGIGNDRRPVYEMCADCHSLDGVSHMPKFPKLAGQNADYIVKQLEDFLHGRRTNDEGQMETAASVITDAQKLEAARYFSSLPPPPPTAEVDGDTARGKELFEKPDIATDMPPCAACHTLSSSKDFSSAVPHLRGQHRSYTAKQLHDFKSGKRANDPNEVMQSIARQLSDLDIEALASFLEAAEP